MDTNVKKSDEFIQMNTNDLIFTNPTNNLSAVNRVEEDYEKLEEML
jgi:hypothetical protein